VELKWLLYSGSTKGWIEPEFGQHQQRIMKKQIISIFHPPIQQDTHRALFFTGLPLQPHRHSDDCFRKPADQGYGNRLPVHAHNHGCFRIHFLLLFILD
jgi:hypothetical protein